MRLVLIALAVAVLLSSTPQPTHADLREIVTPRRIVGVAFLGGSAVLAQKGFDLHDEADEFYSAYEDATDRAEIERLYQRTTNRDVKSQVSWALAAAFGVTGVRLLLTGSPERPALSFADEDRHPSHKMSWRDGIRWFPTIEPGRLSVRFERSLF
ncbi:MAG: hypothetical protein VYB08_11460 [Candidatus Latescibacterota bacterium]|nr:hypothetical protein [Candidatus Latescibacterota bacterium]